jgi:putative effector of murein hydrolase LrgA (UPF0299 family)
MDNDSPFWTKTKWKALYLLAGSAALSVGTPAIVAATQPGARFYLLQPIVFGAQVIPNLVAAALWLPWRSVRASKVGLLLATLLFVASALFYVPVLTGIVPTGGDMIALGYLLFAFVTLVSILVATAVAYTVSWMLARRTKQTDASNAAL